MATGASDKDDGATILDAHLVTPVEKEIRDFETIAGFQERILNEGNVDLVL